MNNRILDWKEKRIPQTEKLVAQIGECARNLFQNRQMLCAEAVVVALNYRLDGGLTEAQAIAMAAPFCVALGKSGCLCGALSGAVMVSGLFLGNNRPYHNRQYLRDNARQLHDAFKTSNGSTCCRVLTKKVIHDKKAHFLLCTDLTVEATELAARLILLKRPELMYRVNDGFLTKHQSKIRGAFLRTVYRLLR